jgi:hypothetical protein
MCNNTLFTRHLPGESGESPDYRSVTGSTRTAFPEAAWRHTDWCPFTWAIVGDGAADVGDIFVIATSYKLQVPSLFTLYPIPTALLLLASLCFTPSYTTTSRNFIFDRR